MNQRLYAIRDAKMNSAPEFFSSQNDETAKRAFRLRMTDPASRYFQSAQDFTIFRVAQWDEVKMRFDNEAQPYQVFTAMDCAVENERHAEAMDQLMRTSFTPAPPPEV